jgi:8-oxo-dGTP diphosphatase
MGPRPAVVVGVGAIVVRDGRLLVVRRANPPAQGLWAVPGGRLEHGEPIADAVVRELAEETGLRGRAVALCGIAERIGEGVHVVIHDWWVEVDGDAQPVAADDAEDVAFVTRSELLALPLVPSFESFLRAHGVWARMAP